MTKCNSEPNSLGFKSVIARVCFLLAKRQKPNEESDDKFKGFTNPQKLSGYVNEIHRDTKRELRFIHGQIECCVEAAQL